jgi:hypothetical protein
MRKLAVALVSNAAAAAAGGSSAGGPASASSRQHCPVAVSEARAVVSSHTHTDRKGEPLRVCEAYGNFGADGEGDVEKGAASFHWVLEESSTSTRENALFSLEECIRRGWSDVVVVTNQFHQWRAGRVFVAAAEELAAAAAAAAGGIVDGGEQGAGAGAGVGVRVRVRVAHMPTELEVATQFPPRGSGMVVRARELWRAQFNLVRELAACVLYKYRGWI